MLGQLLDQIRAYYVNHFLDAFNEYSATDGASITHECAFCNAEGDIVTAGVLGLPTRGDLFVIRDGFVQDSIQVDTERMLSFEPIAFTWPENNLPIDLRPFQWNWMQVRMFGLQADIDWTPIRNWFFRWFRDDDLTEGKLLGAIHFLGDPDQCNGYVQVSIDLGTAPVESFEELLDAFGNIGANRLSIGQFSEGT